MKKAFEVSLLCGLMLLLSGSNSIQNRTMTSREQRITRIVKEVEREYFPELKDTNVRVIERETKEKETREGRYKEYGFSVDGNNQLFFDPAVLALSDYQLKGGIGHELAHISLRHNSLRNIIAYILPSFREKCERDADKEARRRGLGANLDKGSQDCFWELNNIPI